MIALVFTCDIFYYQGYRQPNGFIGAQGLLISLLVIDQMTFHFHTQMYTRL